MRGASAGLAEAEQELVGVAADGGVEYALGPVVGRIGEHVAFFDIDKAGFLCGGKDNSRIDAVNCAAPL